MPLTAITREGCAELQRKMPSSTSSIQTPLISIVGCSSNLSKENPFHSHRPSTAWQRSFLHKRSALPSDGHAPSSMMSHASSKETSLFTPAKQPGKNVNGSHRLCPGLITRDAVKLFDQEFLNRLWSVYSKPKQGVGFLVRSAMVTYQLEVCMCIRLSLHSRQVSADVDWLLVTSKGACTSEVPNVTHTVTSSCPCNFGNLCFRPSWGPCPVLTRKTCAEIQRRMRSVTSNTTNFNNPQQSQWLYIAQHGKRRTFWFAWQRCYQLPPLAWSVVNLSLWRWATLRHQSKQTSLNQPSSWERMAIDSVDYAKTWSQPR